MSSPSPASKHEMIAYYQHQHDDEARMYGHPLGRVRHVRRLDAVRDILAHLTQPSAVVIDLGSGDGYAASKVLPAGFAGTYIGVDLSPVKLRTGRERSLGKQSWAVLGDAERLPLADGCADRLIGLEMLEHLLAPVVALMEIRRVLRPGGIAVLATPVGARSADHQNRLSCSLHGSDQPFQEHVQRYTRAQLLDLFGRTGLAILDIRYCSFSFPFYNRLASRLPYGLYSAIDRVLCHIPIERRLFKGLNPERRTGIGRMNLIAVLQRPA